MGLREFDIPPRSSTQDKADQAQLWSRGGATKIAGARGGPTHVIHPEGAAQIALVGPPNAGKSLLHARLTGSGAHDAPYAFTTQHPSPGMMPYEDVHFQLIDMPAVSAEHPLPWLANTLQTADAALLVVDLCEPACVEQLEDVHATLRATGITLTERRPVANGRFVAGRLLDYK